MTNLVKAGGIDTRITEAQISPISRLVSLGDTTNIELLLEAGCRVTHRQLADSRGKVDDKNRNIGLILAYIESVPNLQRLCRHYIRRAIGGRHMQRKIESLRLPAKITSYLNLDGLGHN